MDNKITLVEQFAVLGRKTFIGGFCSSSYTKPTESIAMGSWLVDVDTGDVNMFDEDAGDWVVEFNLQG